MKRLATLAAGLCVALSLNGCCLFHHGYGGGYGGGCNTGCGYGPQPAPAYGAPYGAGFAPAQTFGGGCPDGNCGASYGPVGMTPIPAATASIGTPAYNTAATVQPGVPATTYTATAPNYMPATATIDPLPTF